MRRMVWPAVASLLLIGSLLVGVILSFGMGRELSDNERLFNENLLDRGSALNRVIFAAQEYAAFPRPDEAGADWVAGKMERCRYLVSQSMIPRYLEADLYRSVIDDDPLLLAERLAASNTAYRAQVDALREEYERLAAAAGEAARRKGLENFRSAFDGFYRSLKEQSTVLDLIETTYDARLRAGLTGFHRLTNTILIIQAAAAVIAILMMIFVVRAYVRDIRSLHGLIPICSNCKKVRDDRGFWDQVEVYLQKHSDADFTHGICPDCMQELYPNIDGKS